MILSQFSKRSQDGFLLYKCLRQKFIHNDQLYELYTFKEKKMEKFIYNPFLLKETILLFAREKIHNSNFQKALKRKVISLQVDDVSYLCFHYKLNSTHQNKFRQRDLLQFHRLHEKCMHFYHETQLKIYYIFSSCGASKALYANPYLCGFFITID